MSLQWPNGAKGDTGRYSDTSHPSHQDTFLCRAAVVILLLCSVVSQFRAMQSIGSSQLLLFRPAREPIVYAPSPSQHSPRGSLCYKITERKPQ